MLSKSPGLMHSLMSASTNSTSMVLGQVSCDFGITYNQDGLIPLKAMRGNEMSKSHTAIQIDRRQPWQKSYRLEDLGKAVIVISYQHGPRETRLDPAELVNEVPYALWEGGTREKKLAQEITYVSDSDIVSILTHPLHTQFSGPDYRRLTNRLWAAFDSEILEDGLEHPAEQIIDETVSSFAGQPIHQWFKAIALDIEQPSFASSVLRCLGRRPSFGPIEWRVDLVQDALRVQDVEIRDAAVQAVESWGDRALVEVIRKHTDREPWLQQYIQDVIDDIGE